MEKDERKKLRNSSPSIKFTIGRTIEVTNSKGRKVKAKIISVNGEFADVEISGKKYLIGQDLRLRK